MVHKTRLGLQTVGFRMHARIAVGDLGSAVQNRPDVGIEYLKTFT